MDVMQFLLFPLTLAYVVWPLCIKMPLLNFEWARNRGNNKVCCYCVYPVELWAGRSAVHKSTG